MTWEVQYTINNKQIQSESTTYDHLINLAQYLHHNGAVDIVFLFGGAVFSRWDQMQKVRAYSQFNTTNDEDLKVLISQSVIPNSLVAEVSSVAHWDYWQSKPAIFKARGAVAGGG